MLVIKSLDVGYILTQTVGVDTDKENITPHVNKGNTSLVVCGKPEPVLMLVRGHRWSPNNYKNARKAGLSVDNAWRASFIDRLTF